MNFKKLYFCMAVISSTMLSTLSAFGAAQPVIQGGSVTVFSDGSIQRPTGGSYKIAKTLGWGTRTNLGQALLQAGSDAERLQFLRDRQEELLGLSGVSKNLAELIQVRARRVPPPVAPRPLAVREPVAAPIRPKKSATLRENLEDVKTFRSGPVIGGHLKGTQLTQAIEDADFSDIPEEEMAQREAGLARFESATRDIEGVKQYDEITQDAATTLQAAWRGRKVRKDLRARRIAVPTVPITNGRIVVIDADKMASGEILETIGSLDVSVTGFVYKDSSFVTELVYKRRLTPGALNLLLKRLPHLKNLKKFYLIGALSGDDEVRVLADSLKDLRNLESLSLGANNIGNAGAVALAGVLRNFYRLKFLYLPNNLIGNEGARALADAFSDLYNLEQINLSDNQIDNGGATGIFAALKRSAHLHILSLANNPIDSQLLRELYGR